MDANVLVKDSISIFGLHGVVTEDRNVNFTALPRHTSHTTSVA
jgi:hypothetical protein